MCGIVGYYLTQTYELNSINLRQSLLAMQHRGPDDEGLTLMDPERRIHQDLLTENSTGKVRQGRRRGKAKEIPHRIGFGHRRFSIVDVSPSGHQPFWSADERVCVAFNGEIYNYVELREELKQKGFQFHTVSDTEVLATAYLAWGVDCFRRFNGFWAVSLYDEERRQLLLARDRIGKAPLYTTRDDCGLYWASEIKGLFAMLGSSHFNIRDQAVIDFLKWERRDLFHETFYSEIHSFPSASYAWVEGDGNCHPVKYWDLPNTRLNPHDISVYEATKRLKELLQDAVRLRLRADVPVSVQLSGGMDSSALLAVAANNASRIQVYTVAFQHTPVNEEPFARKVVEHYADRVDYTVLEVPDDDFFEHADSYVHLMGEPFHSPNQFTNHRIWTTMAKQGFRVNLYGAGGDEVFAGYPSDYFAPYLRYLLQQGRMTRFLKEFLAFSEHRPDSFGFDYVRRACHLFPRALRVYNRITNDISSRYDPFVMPKGVNNRVEPSAAIHQCMIDNMTHWRMNYWLRVDNQNSMGVPLELRSPFLDFRVVEFGFTLPMEFLISAGWMKWILRHALEDLLPRDVIWRKRKMGFPFPLKQWLARYRGTLLSMFQPLDCPYLDMQKFRLGYDKLQESNPLYLWRLASLAMWWKRCVQEDGLS